MPQRRTTLRDSSDALLEEFAQIRAEAGLELEFPPAVEAEAAAAADWQSGPTAGQPREDRRDLELITIDPPDARDLDQALLIEEADGGYRIHYAIADVAAFVRPGGAIDAAAHLRGETIYCPDLRIGLHPPVLSEDAASLLPDQDRPAVLWTIDLDETGTRVGVHVRRALVRSREQLTYEQAQGRLTSSLRLLETVGELRLAAERERGAVSLERPEQVVERLDGAWHLAYRIELPVEAYNAQISLLTGMTAAQLMIDAGVGILRTMPAASRDDLARLRRQAKALDIDWPKGATYAEVLAGLNHSRPETTAFVVAATRLFRGAAWVPFTGDPPEPATHGAVGARYAHVTAPLRRLVDRYGLEIVLSHTAGVAVPDWVRAELPDLGDTMGEAARRGNQVDRACTDAVEAAILSGRVGEQFDAVAIDSRSVHLREPAIEAPCTGDLPVGDDVQVRLTKADIPARAVQFELV